MTRTLLGIVLGLVVATAAVVRAHEEYGFVGILTKVDSSNKRVALKFKENGKDETVVLVITPKTEITKDKQKVATSALKPGITVVVRAWGDGDAATMEALSIRIVPPIGSGK